MCWIPEMSWHSLLTGYMHMCARVMNVLLAYDVCLCHSAHVEVRRQLCWVGFCFHLHRAPEVKLRSPNHLTSPHLSHSSFKMDFTYCVCACGSHKNWWYCNIKVHPSLGPYRNRQCISVVTGRSWHCHCCHYWDSLICLKAVLQLLPSLPRITLT